MERKRTLDLVAFQLGTLNRTLDTWAENTWTETDIELILRKMDDLGDLYKMNGSYYGTVWRVHYDPTEEQALLFNRVSLTFGEFNEIGRPKRIEEIRTYKPA